MLVYVDEGLELNYGISGQKWMDERDKKTGEKKDQKLNYGTNVRTKMDGRRNTGETSTRTELRNKNGKKTGENMD